MNYLLKVVAISILGISFLYLFKDAFLIKKIDGKKFSEDKKINEIYNHIKVDFKDLELERSSLVKKIKIIIIPITFILFILYFFVAFFKLDINQPGAIYFHFFILMLVLAINIIVKNLISKRFINRCKTRLVNFILQEKELDGLNYQAKEYISEDDFVDAKIFYDSLKDKIITIYKGKDLISGDFKGINFNMSQLEVKARIRGSNRENDPDKIFKGTLIEFDFNKEARTNLIIKVDISNKFFGSYLSSRLERTSLKDYDIVKLENPKFEKMFRVISKSPQDARYILKPSFMEELMNLNYKIAKAYFKDKKQYKEYFIGKRTSGEVLENKGVDKGFQGQLQVPMEISIIKNKIYIALSQFDLFDINIYKKYGVDIETIEDYIRIFDVLEIILEDLKSNQDIFKSV